MSSTDGDDLIGPDLNLTLLTLRKPTELKKVMDSVPRPSKAVPKNGLPIWSKLGLECKLPVPQIPAGKIVFSRGKIGEDVRRSKGVQPNFDLTDPYCQNVSYHYVPVHDPHLAHHFAQTPIRNRMKKLGYVTRDGQAICTLKEFNQYRKYLYNKFMDRIHMAMKDIDEKARDDLTLLRVERDVARRLLVFKKLERAREHKEAYDREYADEIAEKKRRAKENEQKIKARMRYLAEYKENNRKERVRRAREKENRLKQRVKAASEMELIRKISMIRQWRKNEKRRLLRLKLDQESKKKMKESKALEKWNMRIQKQTQKINEEAQLLKIYTEDMAAGAIRREKKAEIITYQAELDLARIKLANWKATHSSANPKQLVRKVGNAFEKSKRGAKGLSMELAQRLAVEAMSAALSNKGDPYMTLGQARIRMDMETVLPTAPIKILDEILQSVVMAFARRRVINLLSSVQEHMKSKATIAYFKLEQEKPEPVTRWNRKVPKVQKAAINAFRSCAIVYGGIKNIPPEEPAEHEMKSCRIRKPTPVPSISQLAELTFTVKLEDLPDPVTAGYNLPERGKLLLMIIDADKLLSKYVQERVMKGIDVETGKIYLPNLRHHMEWGEAVECLTDAVVNNRITRDSGDVRRTSDFLSYRILKALKGEAQSVKMRKKTGSFEKDFYVPGAITAGK